jgi:hypothetical protein
VGGDIVERLWMLDRIRRMISVDPIVTAAFRAHNNDFDAVCEALLAYVADAARLRRDLIDERKGFVSALSKLGEKDD